MTPLISVSRLTRCYTISFLCAALLVISGQLVIQYAFYLQRASSLVVNESLRQRMRSQQMAMAALAIGSTNDPAVRQIRAEEMEQALAHWKTAHRALQQGDRELGLPDGNSPAVKSAYAEINPIQASMVASLETFLKAWKEVGFQGAPPAATKKALDEVLANEQEFLKGMDHIVELFDHESRDRVDLLRMIELALASLTILLLTAEALLAFIPATRRIELQQNDLLTSEREQKELAEKLSASLENSRSEIKKTREAEKRNADILHSAMDGFCLLDLQGRIKSVNAAYCQMLGYSAEELLNLGIRDLEVNESPEEIAAHIRQIIAAGRDRFETRQKRKDGTVLDVEVSAQYVPKEQAVMSFFRDITEMKAGELRIRQLSLLKAARTSCIEAIVHSSSKEELLPKICQMMVEQGGFKMAWIGMADAATGMVKPVFSHGTGTEYLSGAEISTDGGTASGRGPTGTAIRENRLVWVDDFLSDPNTSLWRERAAGFQWRSSAAIALRINGKAICALTVYSGELLAFGEDQRELLTSLADVISLAMDHYAQEEERRLREEELLNLRTAVEQSASTIVITDSAGTIEYVNPAFEKASGYTTVEAVGQNPRILKSGEQSAAFYRKLWATITSGKTWQGELHNRRKDGSLYWEWAVISPVRNERGQIIHIIAVKEDITERKDLEVNLREALDRAESANRAKTEFLAVMSHELRTPLNGILGFAELLRESPHLSGEDRDQVQIIQSSGNSLLRLLDDLLDFSRVEGGGLKLKGEEFSLSDLAEKAIRIVEPEAAVKSLRLSVVLGEKLPSAVLGDPERIQQVLLNLLRNAIKFTETGSVSLSIGLVPGEAEPQRICFAVEDTGPGIPDEMRESIFLPFTQGDSTLSRRYDGIGMGLTISKRLVEKMGSTLNLKSAMDSGSTFSFKLVIPSAPAPKTPGGECVTDRGPLDKDFAGRFPARILAVEDNRMNLMLLVALLGKLGYRNVLTVASGEEALALLLHEKVDLIFMDLQMPGIDGIAATRKIRESEAQHPSVPPVRIVALTANAGPSTRAECISAGMNNFLTKPFTMRSLAGALAIPSMNATS